MITPETYVGYARLDSSRYSGSPVVPRKLRTYALAPRLARDSISFGGAWTVGDQRAVAGRHAELRIHVHAHDVYLVLGGTRNVHVGVDGRATRTVVVDGDRLYTLLSSPTLRDGLVDLRFDPGVNAYAFTFG